MISLAVFVVALSFSLCFSRGRFVVVVRIDEYELWNFLRQILPSTASMDDFRIGPVV